MKFAEVYDFNGAGMAFRLRHVSSFYTWDEFLDYTPATGGYSTLETPEGVGAVRLGSVPYREPMIIIQE